MKQKLFYQDDPYAEQNPEPSIPELGKDTPVPPSQEQTREQPPSEKDLMFNRRRPELADQEKETPAGSNRQMQSDLRYTSAMKKDTELKKHEAEKKVAEVASRSNNVLLKIKAVFPFDLFPNTVIVDANKVTIIDKLFFASETITSILLEEITDVVVESNFFLAQLKITYSHHPLQPLHYAVNALHKNEALKAKEIIQGLLVMRISEGVDLSKLQPEEITKQLEKIGKTHENLSTI